MGTASERANGGRARHQSEGMHGVVARERRNERRTGKTPEYWNAQCRGGGAAQRAADGQDTGARQWCTGKRGNRVRQAERERRTRNQGNGVPASKTKRKQRTEKRGIGALGLILDISSALQLFHLAAGQLHPVLVTVAYLPAAVAVVVHLILRSEIAPKALTIGRNLSETGARLTQMGVGPVPSREGYRIVEDLGRFVDVR